MSTTLQTTPHDLDTLYRLTDADIFTAETLTRALDLLSDHAGSLVADVGSETGRREINRIARAVGGAITRLDERRRAYVADLKARPKAIDDLFRTTFRQPAELLKERIRAPLTAWEEEVRAAEAQTSEIITDLNTPIEHGTPAAAIERRLDAARNLELPDWLSEWQRSAIVDALNRNIPRLEHALATARAAEEQAAELERLRSLERAQAESDRLARQTAESALSQANQARQEAEARALAAQQALEARPLGPANPAATPSTAPATARSAADLAHRRALHGEILADLEALGLTREQALLVGQSIAAGRVRHVCINY